MPLTVNTEKDAVALSLGSIRPHTVQDLRIVHIKNTLELDEVYLSKGCLPGLKTKVRILDDALSMQFNRAGDLEYV